MLSSRDPTSNSMLSSHTVDPLTLTENRFFGKLGGLWSDDLPAQFEGETKKRMLSPVIFDDEEVVQFTPFTDDDTANMNNFRPFMAVLLTDSVVIPCLKSGTLVQMMSQENKAPRVDLDWIASVFAKRTAHESNP